MIIKKRRQQSGRVLILTLLIIGVLTMFWLVALTTTSSELRAVGGKTLAARQLFTAEAGAVSAIETFTANMPTGPTPVTINVNDGAGNTATVNILQVSSEATYAAANNLPQQEFEFDPPEGSGSGVNTSVARRYVIRSEAGGRVVQVGIYRVVPK